MPSKQWHNLSKKDQKTHPRYAVCMRMFDLGGFTSFSEVLEAKDKVSEICPMGYDIDEIDQRIKHLDDRVHVNRRPSGHLNKKQRERELKINTEIQEIYREIAR
jgi:hypothetical protein